MSEQLCEILSRSSAVNDAQLKTALETQKKVGGNLAVILVKLRYLTESKLVEVLTSSLKLPHLTLNQLIVSPTVSSLMDVEILEEFMILPLNRTETSLRIATANPLDEKIADTIHSLTGLTPEFEVAQRSDIQKAIDYYCHSRSCPTIEKAESQLKREGSGTESTSPQPVAVGLPTQPPLLRALVDLLVEKELISQDELLKRAAAYK